MEIYKQFRKLQLLSLNLAKPETKTWISNSTIKNLLLLLLSIFYLFISFYIYLINYKIPKIHELSSFILFSQQPNRKLRGQNSTWHSTIFPNRSNAFSSCRSVMSHDKPPTNIRFSSFPDISFSLCQIKTQFSAWTRCRFKQRLKRH
jgi:hypothetical protein